MSNGTSSTGGNSITNPVVVETTDPETGDRTQTGYEPDTAVGEDAEEFTPQLPE